jgi:hypothetical protein
MKKGMDMTKIRTLITLVLSSLLLSGCGSYCEGWTNNGTRDMDGFCGRVYRGEQNRMAQERMAQQQIEQQKRNARYSKCDSYGFKRGTTPFAQCLQQTEQQESIDAANQMQANELARQNQERLFRKSQCYASGRLDC